MQPMAPAAAPGWSIDEVRTAERRNLDSGPVSRYDIPAEAAAAGEVRSVRRPGRTPASVVSDLGAGAGQVPVAVDPQCTPLVVVDVPPVPLTIEVAEHSGDGIFAAYVLRRS
jgi:hypothetical protein